jgi:hypothetical protein
MVKAHRAVAVVGDDQSVTVQVPLPRGEHVEVIVLASNGGGSAETSADEVRRRLRGSVLTYDDPFGPAVPPEEWDALR